MLISDNDLAQCTFVQVTLDCWDPMAHQVLLDLQAQMVQQDREEILV